MYHYRNFESFWKILESDSFWVTNARFSNDDEEQQFGKNIIENLYNNIGENKIKIHLNNITDLNENFIVCFCLEDDKLSQWRGYAAEGGVSIGMDFGYPVPFVVLKSNVNNEVIPDRSNSVLQYVGIDKVVYLNPDDNNDNEKLMSKLQLKNIPGLVGDGQDCINEAYINEIKKCAPYIKHAGFKEENETRLVFRNNQGILNDCIRYKESSTTGIKTPYIVVKMGLQQDDITYCNIRICLDNSNSESDLAKILLNFFLKNKIYVNVQGCHFTYSHNLEYFCQGCTLKKFEGYYTQNRCNKNHDALARYTYALGKDKCIVISQGDNQDKVYSMVKDALSELNDQEIYKGIKVWCEGHLPIRTITVGPCENQKNVIESIRYYCNHKYWLNDVDIIKSNIPFRKSR